MCGATPRDAQATVNKWYPHALDTFGGKDSKFSGLALKYGIRKWGNEELRNMWRADLDTQIEKIGLVVPDADLGRQIY
jgi:ring-1,2-phenylacetyl-CoA epoxidase subunit PaaA